MSEINMKAYDFSANPKLEKVMAKVATECDNVAHTDYSAHADKGYCAFIE